MAELSCENLRKTFGREVVAVDDVSFTVAHQEFLTLLGPSGCGKTTILRLIAGLEPPDSGKILIDGRLVNDVAPQERDMAMVFQTYALYPHMNVFNNLAVSLRIRRVPKQEIESRVRGTAEVLDINELLDRMPKELSGGERQRVALGRAIVRKPKLFLLDEPLSNLDAILREKTRAELRELFSRIGGTVVYVTHDQIEAMSMSDKVAVIDEGRIQQMGSPSDIYNTPQNIFVANFVGSPRMNFITAGEAGEMLLGEELGTELTGTLVSKMRNRELLIGVRPEDIDIEPSGSAARHARVCLTEPLGAHNLVFVDAEGLKLRVLSKQNYRQGDQVSVQLDPERFHFFDAETGRRL